MSIGEKLSGLGALVGPGEELHIVERVNMRTGEASDFRMELRTPQGTFVWNDETKAFEPALSEADVEP